MIRQGRVAVNGLVVTEMGRRVTELDTITVDGQPVLRDVALVYLLLHKPRGYISTARDPQGRPSVLDLLPPELKVYPVGRLDADSEGLMLLTNDGDLAYRVMHPSHHLPKEYLVLVQGDPDEATLSRLRYGVWLEDGPTAGAQVERARYDDEGVWLRFVIHEGRKRQIRRMCEAVGHPVVRLVRTGIGPLKMGLLAPGKFRFLRSNELRLLRQAVGPEAAPMVIAIDGPAASGKTALGQLLAERLGWMLFDTGMLYRALTVAARRQGIDVNDQDATAALARRAMIFLERRASSPSDKPRVLVDGVDVTAELYTPGVDADVSVVAANPVVRQALLPRQRDIANEGDVVVVGRDIGTVVLPGARLKVYLDASPEVRAQRRLQQHQGKGQDVKYSALAADLQKRDQSDWGRENAPLARAADAVIINTDQMSLQEEAEQILALAAERYPKLRLRPASKPADGSLPASGRALPASGRN